MRRARAQLGWPAGPAVARVHAGGVSLSLAAPVDQLFLATEVNEWALCASLVAADPARWAGLEGAWIAAAREANAGAHSPAADSDPLLAEAAALARFAQLSRREANPALVALLAAAAARGLPQVLDEDSLTLGAGGGSVDLPLAQLPAPADIDWARLRDIPTALVTGSNGKTTTVRLLAACVRADGLRAGYNCTDGVFVGGEALERGDYSGPAGARRVLRERRTQAAILETARGGILRRGLAVSQAQVAVVTNVSADHFGEYGIDDLAGLADVKLTVGAVVARTGMLVLNAGDPLLRERAGALAARFGHCPPLGWFDAAADSAALRSFAAPAIARCGVRSGRLVLDYHGATHDLGAITAMPLTVGGAAQYNIANLAGAALAAAALGVRPATIAAVFATFGTVPEDNPGRLMRFTRDGYTVLVDYAHNPDGLRGFLSVARHLQGSGSRLALLLGAAGNRQDADIAALARVAAQFRPDLVVVKENEHHLRGRAPGEVPRLLEAELRRCGLADAALPPAAPGEVEGARRALAWARPGDVIALTVHAASARSEVIALLAEPAPAHRS